jgi:hypothetical protein
MKIRILIVLILPAQKILKVPKLEIFMTELFILSDPIWVGDLGTETKNLFVARVRLIFAILLFYR